MIFFRPSVQASKLELRQSFVPRFTLFVKFASLLYTPVQKKTPRKTRGHLLAYLDSNQDKQNQNLSYYHYTIGQSLPFSAEGDLADGAAFKKECKNKRSIRSLQKNSLIIPDQGAITQT